MAYELNLAIISGNLTADPEIRYSSGEKQTAISRYRLAVNRRKEGTDFISVKAFGKTAEFAEKYLRNGNPLLVIGKIQTGSYTNRDGVKVYTSEVIADKISTETAGVLTLNSIHLEGRLTRDPEYRTGNVPSTRYTLAVTRGYFAKKNGDTDSEFIRCVCFGENAEFAKNYLKKGTAVAISGRIQTGSYTNKEGQQVYTTDVVVDRHEFAVKKENAGAGQYSETENLPKEQDDKASYASGYSMPSGIAESVPTTEVEKPMQMGLEDIPEGLDGFMNIPDRLDEYDELPFN